jgi:inner membrane protein
MNYNTENSLIDRFNTWLKESVTVKLASIGFLVLILLIPSTWVQTVMEERQYRATAAIKEVSAKWSDAQTLSGPVLVVPYKKYFTVTKGEKTEVRTEVEKAFFLPEDLAITGTVSPQNLNRGIFDVVVYDAQVQLEGYFKKPAFSLLKIKEEDILWEDAYLAIGISDPRGIKTQNPKIMFGEEMPESEPGRDMVSFISKGIKTPLTKLSPETDTYRFSAQFDIKGSGYLFFNPLGKNTKTLLEGTWSNPSFDGAFIPSHREVTDSAFKAEWNVHSFNRPLPQQWTEGNFKGDESTFGVKLLMPVDQYQKSIRTAKYGILVIILTFVGLFLLEIIKKIRIHPFQYILIASALIIYYVLQLSISEHLGFSPAYLVSSLATVALITLYSRSFLLQWTTSGLLAGLLGVFYLFIFVITQLQDYALLIGSLGLFLIIAAIMYFSRKVNWYKEG